MCEARSNGKIIISHAAKINIDDSNLIYLITKYHADFNRRRDFQSSCTKHETARNCYTNDV